MRDVYKRQLQYQSEQAAYREHEKVESDGLQYAARAEMPRCVRERYRYRDVYKRQAS